MNNQDTLDAYEGHVQEYIQGTPQDVSGFVKDWLDKALGYISKGSTVLELGTAFGRDAGYIEKAGYKVIRTDATKAFVKYLQEQGHEAHELNAITDDLGSDNEMVLANAVLLHFTVEEFRTVLAKILESLKPKGVFAFTVKMGEGSEISEAKLGSPRFFQYWDEAGVRKELADAGFTILDLASTNDDKWIHVIVQK